MKNTHGRKRVSRILAFLAACILCLQMTFIPAQALEDWSLLSITLSWTDALGNPGFAMATPVPYGTEQAFWAQVDVAAPLDQLVITISHPNHPEYVFDPANGSTLLNVVDSGAVMDMLTAIPITAMANEMFADTYTLYVSTQMMPEDPMPAVSVTARPRGNKVGDFHKSLIPFIHKFRPLNFNSS